MFYISRIKKVLLIQGLSVIWTKKVARYIRETANKTKWGKIYKKNICNLRKKRLLIVGNLELYQIEFQNFNMNYNNISQFTFI